MPTDSPVAAAARKRQEAIRTVDVHFTVNEVTEPNGVSGAPAELGGDGKSYPSERYHARSAGRLLIDGEKLRYEDNHPIPSDISHRWESESSTQVSDGKLIKRYRHWGSDVISRTSARGQIGTTRTSAVGDEVRLYPLHFAFRGVGSPSCKNLLRISDFTSTGQRLTVGKILLDEYVKATNQFTFRIWVDPESDYLVRRFRTDRKSGRVVSLIDVRYSPGSEAESCVPRSWRLTYYTDAGQVARTFDMEVTTCTINQPATPREFDLDFPPGIEVWDRRDEKYYLVRDDGTMHRLKGAGQRVDAETKASLESTWLSRNAVWLALSGVALVLVGATVPVLRRRTRRSN